MRVFLCGWCSAAKGCRPVIVLPVTEQWIVMLCPYGAAQWSRLFET